MVDAMTDGRRGREFGSQQAREAAYRFVARYYDYARLAPILNLLDAISTTGEHPAFNEAVWAVWRRCVQETLDGAPMPELPPPWDS
jgi:hypothetical protein